MSAPANATPANMRKFTLIWVGQTISTLGSSLSALAIGLWLFRETGSVTTYALSTFFLTLPAALLSPLAGVYIDRYNRRWVMILADSVQVLATLSLAALIFLERFQIWHIYLVIAILSIAQAFQRPALRASIALIVPGVQLGRAAGMERLSEAIALLWAPTLAGGLLITVGLPGVLLVDVFTFLIALVTLLFAPIPDAPREPQEDTAATSVWRDMFFGWRYLLQRRGLLIFILIISLFNFFDQAASTVFIPMLLTFANEAVVGVLLSVISAGMLLASLAVSLWGGPNRRILPMLGLILLQGLAIAFVGLSPTLLLITAGSFIWMLGFSFVKIFFGPLIQIKTALEVQGRVFATISFVALILDPLGRLAAGPLADYLFEPLMAADGALAPVLGAYIGVGPGRGMALMIVLLGFALVMLSLFGFAIRPVRNLEDDLPDEIASPDSAGGKQLEDTRPTLKAYYSEDGQPADTQASIHPASAPAPPP